MREIPTSPSDAALLLAAGVLAGTIGSAGGITSLVSYPALLAVGIPPLPANVTNAVALVTIWPGSTLSSRPELQGRRAWLLHWAPFAAAGGAAGVALLLLTPAALFAHVVPYLLVLASVALFAQPWLSAWQERRFTEHNRFLLPGGIIAASLYSGYFGAGTGIMMIALLLFTVDKNLARANALKNALIGAADIVAAIGFAAFGPVRWVSAGALGLGALVGSTIGPSITRRVPGRVLRVLVALAGLGLAIHLWVSPN